MNKKGFTLIELLAVIVLLAVIMVIAVPKILDVINASKNSAADSSIKLVKDAIKTQVTTSGMAGTSFEITGECYLFDFENNNENVQNLLLKNKERIGGSIKYCNGKFEEDTLTFDGTSVPDSDETKIKVCKRATILHTEECTQTDSTSYCSAAGYAASGSKETTTITYGNLGTKGTLTGGDAFDCDVNGDGIYDSEKERFYYVSDYYNTNTKEFENDTAVLIYYNNTTKGAADNTATSLIAYGSTAKPTVAMTNLPTWSNVKLKNTVRNIVDQNDSTGTTAFDYSTYTTRLITSKEINNSCNLNFNWVKGELDNCTFLMENTKFSSESMGTNGFWIETPRAGWSDRAFVVYSVNRDVEGSVITNAGYGVRPVIEVLKSEMSY